MAWPAQLDNASLYNPTAYGGSADEHFIFLGAYLGITLILALLILLFFFRLGDRIYLNVSLFIAVLFANSLATGGALPLLFPFWAHPLFYPAINFFFGAALFSFSFYSVHLFVPKAPEIRHYLNHLFIPGFLGILFLSEFYGLAGLFIIIVLLVLTFVTSVQSASSVIKGEPEKSLYLTAVSISTLGFIEFLRQTGWIHLEIWSANSVRFSSLLNMALMFLIMAERFRIAEKKVAIAAQDAEKRAHAQAGEMTLELQENKEQLQIALASERFANDEQQRFLSMISHEYRTPLAIINGNLELMGLSQQDDCCPPGKEIEEMRRAVTRLVAVMQVSLNRSRTFDFATNAAFERFEIELFLVAQYEEVSALWPNRFFFSSEGLEGCELMAEPHYLKMALFNFLDNAHKYSPPDSPIEVKCCKDGRYLVIVIHNQNVGTTPFEGEDMFKKYERGSNSNGVSGSGIGLWLVREIIEHHKGKVTLESLPSGITTTVRLPLALHDNKHDAIRSRFLGLTKTFLLLIMMLTGTLSLPAEAGVQPLLFDKLSSQDLFGHLEIFADSSANRTFADILAPTIVSRFKPIRGYLHEGYGGQAVWLRFCVMSTQKLEDPVFLRLGPPYLDYVTLYQQRGVDSRCSGDYQKISLGDHIPVAQRPLLNPDFVAPLSLPAGKLVWVYIRVCSSSSLNLTGTLHTRNDFIRYSRLNIFFQSALLGIALVITLGHVLFFFRLGERLFLYFALFSFLGVFLNYLSVGGMLTLFLPLWAHILSDYFVAIVIGGGLVVVVLFSKYFFSPKEVWVNGYFHLLMVTGCLTILSVPLGIFRVVAPFSVIGILTIFVMMSWFTVRSLLSAKSLTPLYLAFFCISNIGYVLFFLRLLGLNNIEWFSQSYVHFTALLNMLLMFFVKIERLRSVEQSIALAARDSEMNIRARVSEMTSEIRDSKNKLEMALTAERISGEQQRRFLSIISHEYLTPLAIIKKNFESVGACKKNDACFHLDEVQKIKRGIDRLVEVMDISLDRGRSFDGVANKELHCVSISSFLGLLFADVASLWPGRFFFSAEGLDGCELMAEPPYLKTALFNLLDNARKYSPPGSPIEVECCNEGRSLVIKIRNQNVGGVPFEGEELFKKYVRGCNSNNTSGAGIGLWLVRQIIEQQKGVVVLESQQSLIIANVQLPLVSQS